MKKLALVIVKTILLATAAAATLSAETLYSNGGVNGTFAGLQISQAYATSDSFTLGSNSTLTGASNIGIWVDTGDTLTSFDWSISTSPDGGGTSEGSGSGFSSATELTPTSSYGFSGEYNVYNVSFTIPDLALAAGTYYLTLQNATTANQGGVYWDQNDGPSTASTYYDGTFLDAVESESFEIDGTTSSTTPEPGTLVLFGSGLLGMAGLIRRKVRL